MPSPSSSHGGGSGPAAGTYLPVAAAAGVTVDTTTYTDPIKGSGKLTTLVFPLGGQGLLAVANAGDAFPRILFGSEGGDSMYVGDGTYDPDASGAYWSLASVEGQPGFASNRMNIGGRVIGVAANPQTQQLVSGTGAQFSTTRDMETVTPVTFNPGAATTATCTVALSPDNVTYYTLGVETEPAGVAFDGTIHLLRVRVPTPWYLKLTVNAQATLGTTTYY